MRKNGYTLVELMVAATVLVFVSLIAMVALTTSLTSASMTEAQAMVQGNLRDTLSELTYEARSAFSERLVDSEEAPEGTKSIAVSQDGHSVTFQVPVAISGFEMVGASTPITYRFETEDLPGTDGQPNAKLDEGEDTNGDGVLTRRLVRVQDDQETIVGVSNNISDVQFALEPSIDTKDDRLTTLHVIIEGSRRYGGGRDNEIVQARFESRIHLEN